MNKKGFTLMELLLVVAVLAIVSAASAPTFFGGAEESMEEALKTKMFAAYNNCVTGTNLLMAIAASHGKLPLNEQEDYTVLKWIDEKGTTHELAEYAPLASRVFENKIGTKYTIYSYIYGKESKCVIIIKKGVGDEGQTLPGMYTMANLSPSKADAKKCLETIWNQIKEEK